MRRKLIPLAGTMAMLGVVAGPLTGPARAGNELQYVSGPGSQFTNYTVPVLVMQQGDSVTYTNIDIAPHDVVAEVVGPDTPLCAAWQFEPGKCPLFWTPQIGLGKSTPIYGLDSLTAGQQVSFICKLHPGMKGTLVVAPTAGLSPPVSPPAS
jgi:plastocyanin